MSNFKNHEDSEDSEEIEDIIDTEVVDIINKELYNKRTLLLNSGITNDIIYSLYYPMIKLIEEDSKKPIHIWINTLGGNATDSLFLASYILSSKTPIYTYCLGQASSGGALILLSGHKRFAYRYSGIMIHSSGCEYEGKFTKGELLTQASGIAVLDDNITDLIKSKSILSKGKIKTKLLRDWYLSAQEALKYGINR